MPRPILVGGQRLGRVPTMLFRASLPVFTLMVGLAQALVVRAQTTELKKQNRYESRYLVTIDPEKRSILALDFNRTELGDSGQIQLEYKGWTAEAGAWSMFLYEDWTEEASASRWPARVGLVLEAPPDGALNVRGSDFEVAVASRFDFDTEKDGIGRIRTAHGRTRGSQRWPAVLEWVIYDQAKTRANAEERGERARRLDPDSFFGRYDWIVLADTTGRLIQVSQGTLTEDFAYRHGKAGPEEVHDVEVRWLETQLDPKSGRHVPVRWLVDVPAWGLRTELLRLGEHRGHGPDRPSGPRPVYRQVSVAGEGRIDGARVEWFGMVEAIQD